MTSMHDTPRTGAAAATAGERRDAYAALLRDDSAAEPQPRLEAARELGEQLVRANVAPEEVAALQAEALQRLAAEQPELRVRDVLPIVSAPLAEVLRAYGLALRERAEQAANANEDFDALAVAVSHDLPAPLRAITGFSRQLLDAGDDRLDERGRHRLTRIHTGGLRLAKLLDDLLALSRLSRRIPRLERLDLGALAETVLETLQQEDPDRAVEVVIAPDLYAEADPVLARALLEQVLSNAWKYTAERPDARIEFGAVEEDGGPVLFVRDNGPGFRPEDSERIFAPFQKLSAADASDGTGIGLAIAKRIAHRHSGRIWAEGVVNEGATFFFTLRARWRAELETPLEELTANEARARAILETAVDGIVSLDERGLIESINGAAERMFGYPAEELAGRSADVLMPEPQLDDPESAIAGHLSGGEEATRGAGREVVGLRKDGSTFPMQLTVSEAPLGEGRIVTAIVRDLSDLKRATEELAETAADRRMLARSAAELERMVSDRTVQLEAANRELVDAAAALEQRVRTRTEQLEAANRELDAFAYSASHDLRTPLRAIDGYSHTLLRDYQDRLDERGRRRLERIRTAAQRLGDLIDDLLQLSRTSRAPLSRRPVDLAPVAEEIAEELRDADPERSVAFHVEAGLVADADPGLMAVVLRNLLGNAWKFSSHHPSARIEVGAEERDGERVFFVRDDGAGFEMRYADKLFGAFERLHGPDEFEGSGIGLATVHRIISGHGGRIWAEGAPEQGATFYFTLPPAAATTADVQEAA